MRLLPCCYEACGGDACYFLETARNPHSQQKQKETKSKLLFMHWNVRFRGICLPFFLYPNFGLLFLLTPLVIFANSTVITVFLLKCCISKTLNLYARVATVINTEQTIPVFLFIGIHEALCQPNEQAYYTALNSKITLYFIFVIY